ncbi:response regulator [Pseudoduganella sp. OTU4001]|uniref:response regulator n=1 Tax=Pseudoduganella sp. OTU4001 TaxID=3043854 RepID=UPI00313DA7C2
MSARILVVEDDAKIAALVADYLKDAGYDAACCPDGAQALELARSGPAFDLFVLDVMLPGMDGIALCRALRTFSDAPIIMLTARVEEIDRLLGLDSGADDYVCKPFSPRELVARVRAHMRRRAPAAAAPAQVAACAGFVVDRAQMRVLHAGVALPLTPVEFRLLAELVDHPDRVYSRQQLLDAAHEDQRETNDRAVDSHIKNIRRKLAAALPGGDCLQSVYGVGYRFELPR